MTLIRATLRATRLAGAGAPRKSLHTTARLSWGDEGGDRRGGGGGGGGYDRRGGGGGYDRGGGNDRGGGGGGRDVRAPGGSWPQRGEQSGRDLKNPGFGGYHVDVGHKLYVGNLSWQTDKDGLSDAFSKFGALTDVHIPLGREDNRPRGFAFVSFKDKSSADAAVQSMNNNDLDGRTLRVNEAAPRGSPPPQRDNNRGGQQGGGGGYGNDRGRQGGYDRGRGGGGDRNQGQRQPRPQEPLSLQPARPWHTDGTSNESKDNAVLLDGFLKGRTVAIFGVPAPFTGACTNAHVPAYVELASEICEHVDELVCFTVADPYALNAWKESMAGATEAPISFMADPKAAVTRQWDLIQNLHDASLGMRSKRFATLIVDGDIKAFRLVEADDVEGDAKWMLEQVQEVAEDDEDDEDDDDDDDDDEDEDDDDDDDEEEEDDADEAEVDEDEEVKTF